MVSLHLSACFPSHSLSIFALLLCSWPMPHIINPASGSIHTFLNTASGSHSAIDIASRIPGCFLFVFKFTYSSPFIVLFIIYPFCQSWTSISFWKCAQGVYQRNFTAYCHYGIGKSEHSGSLKNEKGMGLLNCDICTQFTRVQNFCTRVDNDDVNENSHPFLFCFCFVFIGVKYN